MGAFSYQPKERDRLILEVSEREFRAQNPNDRRESSHRFNATWGQKRIAQKGHLYSKHYEAAVDELEPPLPEYVPVGQRQRTIENAKRWARKKYAGLDQDDIGQEIDLKAWQLEEHELDERGEWARPAYVMTALKNAVHDYARQEIGYQQANHLTDEVIMTTRFDAPPADHDVEFTKKTLKAALLLFVAAPHTLSHSTKDVIYTVVYKNLSAAEHRAVLQCVVSSNDIANRALNKTVSKYIDVVNMYG